MKKDELDREDGMPLHGLPIMHRNKRQQKTYAYCCLVL